MNDLDQLPQDLLHELATAIATAARRTDTEDWIVRNLVRFPKRIRTEVVKEFIDQHFGAGRCWSPWAVVDVSVSLDEGRMFGSAYELIGFLHEFRRNFPIGQVTIAAAAREGEQ